MSKGYYADKLMEDQTEFEFVLIAEADHVWSQSARDDQAIRGRAKVSDMYASGSGWYEVSIISGDRAGQKFWVTDAGVTRLTYSAFQVDDGDVYNPDPSDPMAADSQGGLFEPDLDGATLYLIDDQNLPRPIEPAWPTDDGGWSDPVTPTEEQTQAWLDHYVPIIKDMRSQPDPVADAQGAVFGVPATHPFVTGNGWETLTVDDWALGQMVQVIGQPGIVHHNNGDQTVFVLICAGPGAGTLVSVKCTDPTMVPADLVEWTDSVDVFLS